MNFIILKFTPMAASYLTQKFVPEGLTYDDVLLVPDYSEVLPREVNISSYFSREIKLNTPIVSAAMDTVTEYQLAIAIAQEGGIGVLHKNMSAEDQAMHVRKVKRSESGMVADPVTLNEGATVGDALALMAENKIGGIPVIDKEHRFTGIITNRDLRFKEY
jgi:IMP dehydrogenase